MESVRPVSTMWLNQLEPAQELTTEMESQALELETMDTHMLENMLETMLTLAIMSMMEPTGVTNRKTIQMLFESCWFIDLPVVQTSVEKNGNKSYFIFMQVLYLFLGS